jgi:hypothetical protein
VTYIREIEAAEEAETFTATEARTHSEDDVMAAAITAARRDTDSYIERQHLGVQSMNTNSTWGIQWFGPNHAVPLEWPTYRYMTGTYYVTSPPEYIGPYTTTSELFRTPLQAQTQAELRKRSIEQAVATLRQYNLVDQEAPLFVVKNTQRSSFYQCLATEAMLHHGMSMSVNIVSFDHHNHRSQYLCLYCTTAQLRNTVLAYRTYHGHESNEYLFAVDATNSFDVSSLNDLRTFLRSL